MSADNTQNEKDINQAPTDS